MSQGSSPREPRGSTITGQAALRISAWVTPPSSTAVRGPQPREPTTMRSTSSDCSGEHASGAARHEHRLGADVSRQGGDGPIERLAPVGLVVLLHGLPAGNRRQAGSAEVGSIEDPDHPDRGAEPP